MRSTKPVNYRLTCATHLYERNNLPICVRISVLLFLFVFSFCVRHSSQFLGSAKRLYSLIHFVVDDTLCSLPSQCSCLKGGCRPTWNARQAASCIAHTLTLLHCGSSLLNFHYYVIALQR